MLSPEAQRILDQIHEIKIGELYIPDIQKKERLDAIKLAKQKLRSTKQLLGEHESYIKARWDGRKKDEALKEQRELLPFRAVKELINILELKLGELENIVAYDKPIPPAPTFGTVITTDLDNHLVIVSDKEAKGIQAAWEEQARQLVTSEINIKLKDISHQAQEIRLNMKSTQQQIEDIRLFGLTEISLIGMAALFFIATVGISFFANNPLVIIVGGGIGLFLIFLAIKNRNQKRSERESLKQSIEEMTAQFEELRKLHDKEKIDLKRFLS